MKVKISQLKFNIICQYLLQVAKYIFPLLTLPYLTRVLEPDGYAVRAYVVSVMAFFLVFLEYGFTPIGARLIAVNSEKWNLVERITTSVLTARLCLCAFGLVPLVVAVSCVPLLAENALYTVLSYIGVALKALLPDFAFQGLEKMGIITKRFVFTQLISVVLIFCLIKGPNDLIIIPVIELVSAFVALSWSMFDLIISKRVHIVRPCLSEVVDVTKEGWPYFLSSASTTAFTSLTTVVMGIYLAASKDIAFWSLSMSVVGAVQSMYNPLSTAIFPRVCKERDFRLVKRVLILGLPVIAVLVAVAEFASPLIMFLAGGDAYSDGQVVLRLVLPVLFFSFPVTMLGYPVLGAAGMSNELSRTSVIAALFNVLGLALLVVAGLFSIITVAVLRVMTEAILMLLRLYYSAPCLKDGGTKARASV